MQIQCPNCSARYLAADDQIGPNGRRVRCARCAHVWRVEAPPALADGDGAGNGAGESAAPEAVRVEPLPRNRMPAPVEPKRRRSRGGWILFVVVLILIVAAAVQFRADIVRAWPPATKLYEAIEDAKRAVFGESALAALKIDNYRVEPVGQGADAAIQLSGDVTNTSDAPAPAPYVRIRLRDAAGTVIRDQREPLGAAPIEPGETRAFSMRFEDPEDVDAADYPILEPVR